MTRYQIYIVIEEDTTKPYTIYFGDSVPKINYRQEIYPFHNSDIKIYCDDDGMLKQLEPNDYAFDLLSMLPFEGKRKKDHEEWILGLLRHPIVGPVLLTFKNDELYQHVKKLIIENAELTNIVNDE